MSNITTNIDFSFLNKAISDDEIRRKNSFDKTLTPHKSNLEDYCSTYDYSDPIQYYYDPTPGDYSSFSCGIQVNYELTDTPFYLRGPISRDYVDFLTYKTVQGFFNKLGYEITHYEAPAIHFIYFANCDDENNTELAISGAYYFDNDDENISLVNPINTFGVLTGITGHFSKPRVGDVWNNAEKKYISGGEYYVKFMKFRNETFRQIQNNIKKRVNIDLVKIIEDMEL